MSTTKPYSLAEFVRQTLGSEPPWWAECIADHMQDPPERFRVHATRMELRGPRRMILQSPTGRLMLAETTEPKP